MVKDYYLQLAATAVNEVNMLQPQTTPINCSMIGPLKAIENLRVEEVVCLTRASKQLISA